MSAGIDYGMGKTNIDKKTGIRYGIIPVNNVDFWWDEAEPYYGECGENDDESEESEEFMDEPISYIIKNGDYLAESDSVGDIFIMKSPYFTYCKFCSPCAPGAGYILNQEKDGIKTYCLGPEFYEEEEGIPYKIYEVKTGKEVK